MPIWIATLFIEVKFHKRENIYSTFVIKVLYPIKKNIITMKTNITSLYGPIVIFLSSKRN